MHDDRIPAVVTGKRPVAQGYYAVEFEMTLNSELPPFEDGAIVDLIRHNGIDSRHSLPLWHDSSRRNAFVVHVRQEPEEKCEEFRLLSSWNRGDEIYLGAPRGAEVAIDPRARHILFSAGVGATAIAGFARRLASTAGCCFEVHNFARTPERLVFRAELDELSERAQIRHQIGLSEEQIANATAHAVSPTQANSRVICSGPPAFMELIERQALQWVYPSNVHKIILGETTLDVA
ncbi:Phthalate dioxygenase reductase [Paraburkholderia caffeinitolerans]|uniref:Phthalate dioxygenase reductase n=1 Tax=Paraburkholderia caffeinitolerans TaxID=1723730 RepID=A0A6J5FNH9_9BURK|nr:Phthalate dioxygenase reductase [Paraburkholderia caffeinitolerans]CAB3802519.1 Phthalate dioxygenase reductase [Paraburkholderia caffeinilytica]